MPSLSLPVYSRILFLSWITTVSSLSVESSSGPLSWTQQQQAVLFSGRSTTRSLSVLRRHAKPRYYRGYYDDDEEGEHDDIGRQRSTDRPTETVMGIDPPEISPSKPKIVVLGATGRVGRLVVRQLLEMESMDMTVVAFVRDYDKAIRVLYDDLVVARANNHGPKLQIVEGDLVPREELPGHRIEDAEDEKDWKKTAVSAARYFGNKVEDYDNRGLLPDVNESLEEALKGCTTVISCLGAFRPTNLWTDLLARPFWRILKADVSRWCQDRRHPYYVHYTSTRKALGCVEREQIQQEAAAAALVDNSNESDSSSEINVPKIRFIRISDLCVGQKPWHFVPFVTNVIQSVIFRYHEMAEQLLEASSHVETIILRPGDLVDDERDTHTTSLQVSHTGYVPSPARIGREDVASIAIAAAMFETPVYEDDDDSKLQTNQNAFHYTFACRWAGQQLNPFPPQGVKADGAEDATTAIQRVLKVIEKNERRKRTLLHRRKNGGYLGDLGTATPRVFGLTRQRKRQPHGLCVAVPVYIMLGLFARTLLHPLVKLLPGGPAVLAQLGDWLLLGASFIMGKLAGVLPFVARRKQYISF